MAIALATTPSASVVKHVYDYLAKARLELRLPTLALSEMLTGSEPDNSLPIDVFRLDYLTRKALTKVGDLKGEGLDPRSVAVERFLEAEEMCRKTNSRLRFRSYVTPAAHHILWGAEKLIAGWLPSSARLVQLSWGPGTTSSCKGVWTGHYNKLAAERHATCDLIHHFGDRLRDAFPGWFSAGPLIERNYGDVTFVPKTCTTHRSIVVEPHVNAALQRCFGQTIRSSLRRVGLNLDRQADIQRHLAKVASCDDSLATIDLSMASDTLSRGLVERLLPDTWVRALYAVRTPSVKLDGKIIVLEKFSSMGNGFTWELESMIFYAIALSTCQYLGLASDSVGVFGDDIIVPSASASLLIEILDYCGFRTNNSKTFVSGPFRESCGKDYYQGIECRPAFLRDTSHIGLVSFHNTLVEWGAEYTEVLCPLLDYIRAAVKAGTRTMWVPRDTGFGLVTDNPILWVTRFNRMLQRREVRCSVFRADEQPAPEDPVQLEDALISLERRNGDPTFSKGRVSSARRSGRWRKGWVGVSRSVDVP